MLALNRWVSLTVVGISLALLTVGVADSQNQPLSLDVSGDPLPEGAIARLGTIRSRPGGPLRFSTDGKSLLVASLFGNTIYLRDGFNGKALRRFEVKGRPQILGFSPDGKTVALIDRSGGQKEVPGIHLRDIATGKQVAHLDTGYGKAVLATVFAPDGKTIATATTDPVIVIWDAATGKKLHELPVGGRTLNIKFDQQGKTLHVGVFQQGLILQQWDIAKEKKLKGLPPFDKEIRSVNISPDGQLLALSGHRGATNFVVVTDAGGKELYRFDADFGFRSFSPNGNLLAVSTSKGAEILDARTGKQRSRLDGFVYNILFSPDGKRIASNISAGSIGLWEVTGHNLYPFEKGHGGPIRDLAFSPNGKTLFVSGLRLISIWDLDKQKALHRIENGTNVTPKWDFLTNGRLLASSTKEGTLQLWDQATGKERDSLDFSGPVVGLDLSPDGKTLAAVVATETKGQIWPVELQLWDAGTKKEKLPRPPFDLRRLIPRPLVSENAAVVAFSPDGKLLAVSDYNQVLLWQVGSDKKPRTLLGADQKPTVLRFSPDGRLLGGACDRHFLVWDVATGTVHWKLSFKGIPEPAFDDPCHWLAFSADGRAVLIAHGGSIRFWELASKEERWTLNYGAGALALTSDQRLLASGDDSSAILLWDMKRLGLKGELEKLTPAQLEMLWADLDGKARPGFVAMQRLAAAPKQAVPFLAERLRAKAVDPERVRDLVSDLGSPKLPVRDMASAELRKLGAAAEDRLRKASQDDPSPDTRRRVQELLKLVESSHRDVRAIELLERIGTSEAQDLLARLGKEAPSLRLRQQALDSVARIQKRVAGVK